MSAYFEGLRAHLGNGVVRDLPGKAFNIQSKTDVYSYDTPASYDRVAHYVHETQNGFELLMVTKDKGSDVAVSADRKSIAVAGTSTAFLREITAVWQSGDYVVVCLRIPDSGPRRPLAEAKFDNPIYCVSNRGKKVWTLSGSYYSIGEAPNPSQIEAIRSLAVDIVDVASGHILSSRFNK